MQTARTGALAPLLVQVGQMGHNGGAYTGRGGRARPLGKAHLAA